MKGRTKSGRGDLLVRSMLLIRLLSFHAMTARELSEELECNVRTVYRYINAASLVFPVREIGGNPARYTMKGERQ